MPYVCHTLIYPAYKKLKMSKKHNQSAMHICICQHRYHRFPDVLALYKQVEPNQTSPCTKQKPDISLKIKYG